MARIENGNLGEQVAQRLRSTSQDEKSARSVGNSLSSIEDEYIAALSKPNPKEGEIQALGVKYQRAMRIYEAFQTLMKNAHEIMMRAIDNLAMR